MWQRLKIQVSSKNTFELEQKLTEFGALSISYIDAANQPIFQNELGSTPLWDTTWVLCLFEKEVKLNDLLTELKDSTGTFNKKSLKIELIEDQDWEFSWMNDFHPMRFGDKLWICPSWQSPPDPHATNIMLDPGLAFGSGTHTTTDLCLRWLDKTDVDGKEIIDFGCGSGVLGIGAAMLGAAKVYAVDNDPQAITATIDNRNRNNTSTKVLAAYLPDALPKIQADILIANILAEPLVNLSAKFAKMVKPNGHIALSGLLEEQIPLLVRCYENWFDIGPPIIENDWVLLAGTRKA
ncbi:MAG: 50S ribosomal protein L11 methyltransferase [Gammaproteobacteria bacterium]|nr:50S ribosomal protein L11 methyltransferase [Gammaproteobacteria bacterium]|tara:strand:+ start:406 stop:1287 length:882 start_codon:yes stop_codon:yes gene_type:complete